MPELLRRRPRLFDDHRHLFQFGNGAGNLCDRLSRKPPALGRDAHARRPVQRHLRHDPDRRIPQDGRLQRPAGQQLGAGQLASALQRQLLPQAHEGRGPLCGRRNNEALRGRRPLLARVVLLGQGQDLRRRALVRRADRPRRRRTALQGPRPARLRHAEGPRRPRLRRHLVLQGQQIRQHQRHQPLCGAGPEIAHLPLRGNLAEVPRAGRQRGMAPRVRRRLGGADGRQPLFAGLDGRRGDDQLQQGLQERGAAVHRSDPGQRVQRHAQPVSRRLVVLRLGQLRTTQLGSQSVRQHVPEPRRDALHGQGRIPAATTACARPSSRPTTSRRSAARRPTNSQRSSPA